VDCRRISGLSSGAPEGSRPPKDDMVLELAMAAGCQTIVTFNVRDFTGIDQSGVSVARPGDFLSSLGAVR